MYLIKNEIVVGKWDFLGVALIRVIQILHFQSRSWVGFNLLDEAINDMHIQIIEPVYTEFNLYRIMFNRVFSPYFYYQSHFEFQP
ncbi:hypothetical protein BAC3_01469 [uncultured bacterium]|nr:hypothetical protein BAC3_01469 [uncultured bacterium]